ncbi:MAG: DNA gyrase subunit A, partial [Chroococcidiopsidaceae cyanobacterium CP_BM_ER_R8_30]|nr:DNA gyrase subunit A [Chroococcidiopsidaceae cyanobacterium CP_BM_ER_R8_30]
TQITDLRDILVRRERILAIIETEVTQLKTTFVTPRRTVIEPAEGEFNDVDLIANEKAVILLTEQGYIKRMPVNAFEAQNRATRGKAAARVKEDDGIEHFLTCCDHDSVLFFSDRGVVYCLKAYQIPVGSRTSRGVPIVQMLPIPRNEKITSIVPVTEFTDDEYLVMLTRGGYIKKTELAAFSNIRANGLIAICLEEGDQLRWVRRARVEDSILIGSRQGMAIHFRTNHEQLRPLGRATRGVRAMKLRDGDELIGMDILPGSILAKLNTVESELAEAEEPDTEELDTEELDTEAVVSNGQGPWVLIITMAGYGKRVPVSQFKLYNRATKGKIATKFKPRKLKDQLAAIHIVNEDDELMMVTNRGIIIRQAVSAIPPYSRSATGVRVQRLDEDDVIAAVALVPLSAGDGEEE